MKEHVDDGDVGLNVLGCQVDILGTNCNKEHVNVMSFLFEHLSSASSRDERYAQWQLFTTATTAVFCLGAAPLSDRSFT